MKKTYLSICLAILSADAFALSDNGTEEILPIVSSQIDENSCLISDGKEDQEPFIGEYQNDEFKIFIRINFSDKNITVPKQDILGELDGYIGSTQCDHVWPIVSSEVNGSNATLEIINNFGSEDFTATLTKNADGTLTLKHIEGSTLKFPVNKKWQKIPSKIVFHRK